MSDNNKQSKVTWIKDNRSHEQYLYDNDIAMQDRQAKQVMQGNSRGLSSKDIRNNPWLSEEDFE